MRPWMTLALIFCLSLALATIAVQERTIAIERASITLLETAL